MYTHVRHSVFCSNEQLIKFICNITVYAVYISVMCNNAGKNVGHIFSFVYVFAQNEYYRFNQF